MTDPWRDKLTDEQYRIMRERGTEPPFSGKFVDHHGDGMYTCVACNTPLFASDTKFDSGSGWPSFSDVISKGNVELKTDTSHCMSRTEVICATCGGHLGHLFDDGPKDKTGLRYCINSACLDFKKK